MKDFLVVTHASQSIVVSSVVLHIGSESIRGLYSPMVGSGVKLGFLFFTYYFTQNQET